MFHVRTATHLPQNLDPEVRADLLQRDRNYVADHLAEQSATVHRAVGAQVDFMLIDVPDAASLDSLLSQRPVARYARVDVTALRS